MRTLLIPINYLYMSDYLTGSQDRGMCGGGGTIPGSHCPHNFLRLVHVHQRAASALWHPGRPPLTGMG